MANSIDSDQTAENSKQCKPDQQMANSVDTDQTAETGKHCRH